MSWRDYFLGESAPAPARPAPLPAYGLAPMPDAGFLPPPAPLSPAAQQRLLAPQPPLALAPEFRPIENKQDVDRAYRAQAAAKEEERIKAEALKTMVEQGQRALPPGTVPGLQPAPMIAPTVIKGGRRVASWNVQEGTKLSDETKEIGENLDLSREEAVIAERDAMAKENEDAKQYLAEQQYYTDQRALLARQRAEQFAQRYKQETDKLADFQQAVSDNPSIIPDRDLYAKDDGARVLQQIVGMLGAAMGAAYDARTGRGDPYMEGLNRIIAQNIARQKGELEAKQRKVDGQANLLGVLKMQFGSTEAAEEAAHMAYLQSAANKLKAVAANSRDPKIQAQYKAAMVNVNDEIYKRRANFEAITQDKIARLDQNVPDQVVGGVGGAAADKIDKATNDYAEKLAKAGIPQMQQTLDEVDSVLDPKRSPESAKDFGKYLGAADQAMWKASPLLYGKARGQAAVNVHQTVQSMENIMLRLRSGGAVSDGEASRLMLELRGSRTPDDLARASGRIRRLLQVEQDNIKGGAPAGTHERYLQKGGSVRGRGSLVTSPSQTAPVTKAPVQE